MKQSANTQHMVQWAKRLMLTRQPDMTIGPPENPYLHRWHVIPRNQWGNVYLHKIVRSDDDRALHDHPWDNSTWLLEGGYWEHLVTGERLWRAPGWQGCRTAETLHRLEIEPGGYALTLFTTGPKVREWGFQCPNGWVHWEDFTAGPDGALVGNGCGG